MTEDDIQTLNNESMLKMKDTEITELKNKVSELESKLKWEYDACHTKSCYNLEEAKAEIKKLIKERDWEHGVHMHFDAEVQKLKELSGEVLRALHNWDPTADACSITLDKAVEELESAIKSAEVGKPDVKVVGVSGWCPDHNQAFTNHLFCDKCIRTIPSGDGNNAADKKFKEAVDKAYKEYRKGD